MKPLKIILAASESLPFVKTGGLADVIGSLASTFKSLDQEVVIFLPYYQQIKEQGFKLKRIKKDLVADFGQWDSKFSLYHCKKNKLDFYFIKKDEYFKREFFYGPPGADYPDNALRFGFFSNAVLSSAVALDFKPDIIHCNDWQTGLIPFYLKYKLGDSQVFSDTKTLFTIHNLAYQGLFPKEILPKLGVGREFFTPEAIEFYGKVNFMKSGILYSDFISTVSKGYAREILTKEFGCGLQGLLCLRKSYLYGIVNGVDYSNWNPASDKFIKANYDSQSLQNKAKCKLDLLAEMKLPLNLDTPLLGFVGRLVEQKGIDVIAGAASYIKKSGCNLVILGTGDKKYVKILRELKAKYRKNIAVKIDFNDTLAHKIEAGSDIFLMPSRYEPCGLNQMYSLKYGTLALVSAVGGLSDTIVDYNQNPARGCGFKLERIKVSDFRKTLKRALIVYKNRREWSRIVKQAMGLDFSWEKSAKEYLKVYNLIRGKKK